MNRRNMLAGSAVIAAAFSAGRHGVAAEAPMIERKIPASGESIPVIGLGTSGPFEVGTSAAERAPLQAVLAAFFASGATLIDTSPMYSSAEAVLGDLLTPAMQKRVFMATKVWADGEQAGIEQMTRSMALLGRERLDLIQVHNLRDLGTHLKTLRKWKDEGKVRHIGVTHYTVASHADLESVIKRDGIDFVQLNYSAVTRDAEKSLLPLAADRGVAVLVNRAFEDGKIFSRLRDVPVPEWAAEFDCTSWAQMLLKYVIANTAVTCVIPATGKVRNLRDNVAAGRGRLPSEAQRRRIVETIAQLS